MKRYLVLVANIESEYIEKRKWCDNEKDAVAFVDGYNNALIDFDHFEPNMIADYIEIDSDEITLTK